MPKMQLSLLKVVAIKKTIAKRYKHKRQKKWELRSEFDLIAVKEESKEVYENNE